MALPKQVWTNQIMEGFYPDSSFLMYARDFTSHVDNDIINMAEAGVDPVVLINNNTYPIAVVQRTDAPIAIELDKFETENTLVRRPDVVELAYEKLESVLVGHRNALRTKTGEKAAHAFAPSADSTFTPIVPTTGGDDGDGLKQIQFANILTLKRKFDDLEIPKEKRFLVMNPKHVEQLILSDLETFKNLTDFVNGKPNTFAGFRMLEYSRNPKYNRTDFTKVAFGAAPDANDTYCSFAFSSDEVMKADGNIYLYERRDDPEERATIVGFDKRFIALPIRNKAIGAIVAAAV